MTNSRPITSSEKEAFIRDWENGLSPNKIFPIQMFGKTVVNDITPVCGECRNQVGGNRIRFQQTIFPNGAIELRSTSLCCHLAQRGLWRIRPDNTLEYTMGGRWHSMQLPNAKVMWIGYIKQVFRKGLALIHSLIKS